jgi:hypothetical protein
MKLGDKGLVSIGKDYPSLLVEVMAVSVSDTKGIEFLVHNEKAGTIGLSFEQMATFIPKADA